MYTIEYSDFTSNGLVVSESQYTFDSRVDAAKWLKNMNYFKKDGIWVEDKSAIKGYAKIKKIK
jgi:hypothetical protein